MKKLLCVLLLLICKGLCAQQQEVFTVLISEVMFDPEPAISLPPNDYIELLNRSGGSIDLYGWTISTPSDSYIVRQHTLVQDSRYIIISAAPATSFADSTVLFVQLPGFKLANAGGYVLLVNPAGDFMHSMRYDPLMHSNNIKQKGGWSLELMDIESPCLLTENWRSSIDMSGGTPGKNNSISDGNTHLKVELLQVNSIDLTHLSLITNRSLDSLQISSHLIISFDPALPVAGWSIAGIGNETIEVELAQELDSSVLYSVQIDGINDCTRNLAPVLTGSFGVIAPAMPGDVIFNEIMYHPAGGASEYIELYNTSAHAIDLKTLYISRMKANGSYDDPSPVSNSHRALMPGDFMVLSRNPAEISADLLAAPNKVVRVDDLPAMPDNEGVFVLQDAAGKEIDRLSYYNSWHVPLLLTERGIALERVSSSFKGEPEFNWTSAASPYYGTPGRKNSQAHEGLVGKTSITIEPETFTPDNDGNQDHLFIRYTTRNTGSFGSIRIADIHGRIVRTLVSNFIAGAQGEWTWNGYDDHQRILPTGIYIVVVEVFDVTGKKFKIRQAVTLAQRI